jgi:hypothetical protein
MTAIYERYFCGHLRGLDRSRPFPGIQCNRKTENQEGSDES